MSDPGEAPQTAGQLLRQARQARGLALADVAAATRIGVEYLAALEEDSADDLLAPLYVRSFLRAQAAAVGASPEEALALYDRQRGQAPAAEPVWEAEPTVRRVGGGAGRWLRLAALLIGAALVVAVAVRALDRAGPGWLRRPAPPAAGLGPAQDQPGPRGETGAPGEPAGAGGPDFAGGLGGAGAAADSSGGDAAGEAPSGPDDAAAGAPAAPARAPADTSAPSGGAP